MSLPWIQMDKDFPRSPEAITLGHELGVSRAHAVGLCAEFWSWAADHAADGRVDGALVALVIDNAVNWHKPTQDAPSFFEAMLTVGLLERYETGVRIVGWGRYAKALEKSAKDADRKRSRRGNGARLSADIPADGAETARVRRAFGAGKSQIESQSQTSLPSEESPAAAEFKLVEQKVPTPRKRSDGLRLWDWYQGERQKLHGLAPEPEPDHPKINAWYAAGLQVAKTPQRVATAGARFLVKPKDDYWPKRGWPFNGFMSKYRDYLPSESEAA